MTGLGSTIAAFLTGALVAAGGFVAGSADERSGSAARTALVVDAAAGRHGRALVDPRLRDAEAQVRLPRTAAEASANVRYFAAQGYRLVVTGPEASEAARAAGVPAVSAPDVPAALAAVAR